MARVPASDTTLSPFFDRSVGQATNGQLPCGICSIHAPKTNAMWAICPRRLLSFNRDGISDKQMELAKRIFSICGYESGQEVSVWSEVTLKDTGENGAQFNYRLDYVLRTSRVNAAPMIIEVMTCSTSGGNRSQGKDIQGAFRRAVVSVHSPPEASPSSQIRAPGVNVRQVWARMASQMIAKSEAANGWGGRTIWVVQDHLVDYIRRNTALPLDDLHAPDWAPGEVNMLVSDLTGPTALYSGPIRPTNSTRPCWMELLGAPHIPDLEAISQKLDEKPPIATFCVP